MGADKGTVLLTGAAGRIGGKVLRRLLEKDYGCALWCTGGGRKGSRTGTSRSSPGIS